MIIHRQEVQLDGAVLDKLSKGLSVTQASKWNLATSNNHQFWIQASDFGFPNTAARMLFSCANVALCLSGCFRAQSVLSECSLSAEAEGATTRVQTLKRKRRENN
jgi:hypothetical protein